MLFWTPEEGRKKGRPNITLKDVLQKDTGLTSNELRTAMADKQVWRNNYVMSPNQRSEALLLLEPFYCPMSSFFFKFFCFF